MNKNDFFDIVKPLSITSKERIYGLWDSLEYIRINSIPGVLVECGVMFGGNILGMMEYCKFHNLDRMIWAYDTFEGMTSADSEDVDCLGNCAGDLKDIECRVDLEQVKLNLSRCDYPVVYVKGDVCKTLDVYTPPEIALLRLDTDFYRSTKKELETLYPLITRGGVLIVDDYGHWRGCKKAVDEYFNGKAVIRYFDYTGIRITK